jgi:hypothetical protein
MLPSPDNNFWSSTEKSWDSTNAWNVNLNNGNTNNNTKVTLYYVRCVRRKLKFRLVTFNALVLLRR